MATTVVSAAAHQIPPMSIPRVRPPRLLKGTPSPNTNPQPEGQVPHNKVWIQGQWRNPSSNAAKHIQEIQSQQIERAIHHDTHGMNIYAYSHVRLNRVIYSLTKNLDNTQSLNQMLYHGKQTVPAALRRDMWRPYFSVHFAQTPAGSRAGLLAYQRLRELSVQRQLSPPEDLITTTQADVDRKKSRANPIFVEEMLDEKKPDVKGDPRFKVPILGQVLPKKIRARVLMNQKATSVADVAFVLALANARGGPEEQYQLAKEKLLQRYKAKGSHGRAVMRKHRRLEEAKKELIRKKVAAIQSLGKEGKMHLDKHTAHRLSMEYDGALDQKGRVIDMVDVKAIGSQNIAVVEKKAEKELLLKQISAEIEERQKEAVVTARGELNAQTDGNLSKALLPKQEVKQILAREKEAYMEEQRQNPSSAVSKLDQLESELTEITSPQPTKTSSEVKILWSDLRDGTYAESWPENVYHAELEPRAISKRLTTSIRQKAMTDDEGHFIEQQKEYKRVFAGSSAHVIGGERKDGWVPHGQQIERERQDRRQQRLAEIKALQPPDDAEEMPYEGLGGPTNSETAGIDVLNAGPQIERPLSSSKSTREEDIQAMREQGVEVDGPKKGVWGRIKGMIGR